MPIEASRLIAETIVSQTQSIAQAASNLQVVGCDNVSSGGEKLCAQCLILLKDAPKQRIQCYKFCQCSVKDVHLDQVVVVDFKALLTIDSDAFVTSFLNNLYLQAQLAQTGLPGLTTEANVQLIRDQTLKIFTQLKTTSVQLALQSLAAQQVVFFNGPATVIGLNLTQAVEYINSVLQTNQEIAANTLELDTYIASVSTKLILTATDALIVSLLMIVAIAVAVVLIYVAIRSALELLQSAA
jgi:hypothetical protein